MAYIVARGKAEAKVEFTTGGDMSFECFDEAVSRMDYENKYGYFKEFEHFVYEVVLKVKAKKLI